MPNDRSSLEKDFTPDNEHSTTVESVETNRKISRLSTILGEYYAQ